MANKKRVLKNIDFSREDSHIALVGPAVGGPANGADYALVIKSSKIPTEVLRKMQQVKVTMDTPEFLRRFFYLYGCDAEILARLMGYVPPVEDDANESDSEDKSPADIAEDAYEAEYEKYIQDQVAKFEIVKSASALKNVPEILKEFGQEGMIAVLDFQNKYENVIKMIDRISPESTKATGVAGAETSTENLVENTDEANASVNVEKSMEDDVKPEMVEKSQLDNLLVELNKAKETIASFEQREKEAIQKARKDRLVAAVSDEKQAEVLFKSLVNASDEDFEQAVSTLEVMRKAVEKSSLFEEKGAAVDTQEPVVESGVMKALKSQKIVK